MTYTPDVVIYHHPCSDGMAAAWAVWERWPKATYLPAAYNQPVPLEQCQNQHVLLVDFSYRHDELVQLSKVAASVVVLDHHRSAQQELSGFPNVPYLDQHNVGTELALTDTDMGCCPVITCFDMDRSGATLAWYFAGEGSIPRLISYVEDRDLWRWQLVESEAVNYYISSKPLEIIAYRQLHQQLETSTGLQQAKEHGRTVAGYINVLVDELLEQHRLVDFDMDDQRLVTVPVVNIPKKLVSTACHRLLTRYPDSPFSVGYTDRADGMREWSLRSRGDVDVSAICRAKGGGGHLAAAGFTTGQWVTRPRLVINGD